MKSRFEELERELDEALKSRHEWMVKVTQARGELIHLRLLLGEAARALAKVDKAGRHQKLIVRLRQGAR